MEETGSKCHQSQPPHQCRNTPTSGTSESAAAEKEAMPEPVVATYIVVFEKCSCTGSMPRGLQEVLTAVEVVALQLMQEPSSGGTTLPLRFPIQVLSDR